MINVFSSPPCCMCCQQWYQLQRRIYRHEWSSKFNVCNLSSCENKALKKSWWLVQYHQVFCQLSCQVYWELVTLWYIWTLWIKVREYMKEQILQCWEIWIHSRLTFFRLYLHSPFYSCVHNCLGHLCLYIFLHSSNVRSYIDCILERRLSTFSTILVATGTSKYYVIPHVTFFNIINQSHQFCFAHVST